MIFGDFSRWGIFHRALLCNIRFLYWVALKLHWSKLYLLPSWLFNWCILRSLLSANSSLQKFNLVCLDLLRVPTGQSHIRAVFSAPELGESLPCIGGEAAAVDVNIRRFKHFLLFCESIFIQTFPGSPLTHQFIMLTVLGVRL